MMMVMVDTAIMNCRDEFNLKLMEAIGIITNTRTICNTCYSTDNSYVVPTRRYVDVIKAHCVNK